VAALGPHDGPALPEPVPDSARAGEVSQPVAGLPHPNLPRPTDTLPAAAQPAAAAPPSGRVEVPRLRGLPSVLRIRAFRRLWLVLGLSSLGDWLGLLATATFVSAQVSASAAKGAAFGTVIAVQLLPAVMLGPLAGVFADRFDRRYTMVAVDILRFLLITSIPTVQLFGARPAVVVGWAAVAMFCVQTAALLWVPAKEAAVPNLLSRAQLETANQLTLITTYGITPVLAAGLLGATARLPALFGVVDATALAVYFNALTFLASALVVLFGIEEISGRTGREARQRQPSMLRGFAEGWRYVVHTPLVRGLVLGILGAFAGGGVVIGTAKFFAQSLGGGDATFATLFATLFVGLGVGILAGPRIVGRLSRRRWFGLSIVLAGVSVAGLALAPRLSLACAATVLVGAGAGMAFLSGITLLGGEVRDVMRGRVFAFVQTAVRVTLMLTISATGVLVGVGSSRQVHLGGQTFDIATARVLLVAAGLCGVAVGVGAFRQMDDARGVPVLRDVAAAVLRRPIRAGTSVQTGTRRRDEW
jgi:dTMP kinase